MSKRKNISEKKTDNYAKNFDLLYEDLNTEQKEAVEAIDGPVLVVAGPGTGKTQVLSMRIANILKKTDTASSAILALTFTESGVKAMRERLLSIIGPEAYYVSIYTFHSFCSDVLKTNPDKFVISEEIEPLSDLERIGIFREILNENTFKYIKPFGSRYYYVKALIKTIQDLKREGVKAKAFVELLDSFDLSLEDKGKLLEVARAYELYQAKLAQKARYDFEDMINLVIERFDEDKELLADYQERFLYILVDEYQDTNTPQNRMISLLASYWGEDANVFAVGDDAQSIYRFQGASIQNILYFRDFFPGVKTITLKKNYRSNTGIIKASEELISNNEVSITNFIKDLDKNQEAASKVLEETFNKVEVGHFSSGITESFFVARKIQKLVEEGVQPSEIAVIYRNNRDSKDFSDMLARMGISFNLLGGENVLEDHDIEKLLKLFDVILKVRNKEEDIDLFTILNYDFLNFNYVDTLKLSRFASTKKINFVEAINHADFEGLSEVKDVQAFRDFLDTLLRWQGYDANLTFVEFFEKVIEESGFLNFLLKSKNSVEKLNRLNSLFAEIKKLNIADHALNLQKFMEDVAILRDSGIAINEEDLNIRTNAVLLTTAHKSKGLEFEYVFIVKAFDGKWGNNKLRELIKLPEGLVEATLQVGRLKPAVNGKSIDNTEKEAKQKEKNEDERRLFYVAMTRAKCKIFITYADSYLTESGSREAIPSMFISEISKAKKNDIDILKYESAVKEILKDILKPIAGVSASIEEKDFLKTTLANFPLSVTALNTYLECPYKFKLNNLLRTPRAKDKYLAFGTASHTALEKFFRAFKNEGRLPDFTYLLEEFETAISTEILTRSDFLESLEKGRVILKAYFDAYKDEF
ncbi:MAG: ATP-dependent DNA helicase, partial [Patescibacteria group bacterium]